jgi:protein-disulfide isomerase
METTRMRAAPALVALIAALASLAAAPRSEAADPPPATDQVVASKAAALQHDAASPVIGNRAGDVTVVEFFDYNCSFCKATEPRLEALLKADKGVRLIVKEFPILTPESMIASKAALASVKQGKYAPFHQALMNYRGPLTEPVIFDTAKSLGIKLPRLRKDMASPAITDEILANFNLARSLRVFGTPTFIVGDHILTGPSAEIDFPRAVAAARAN